MPAFDAIPHIRAGRLVEILPELAARRMPVFALYPHRRYMSQRVKVFVAWMRELLDVHLHV